MISEKTKRYVGLSDEDVEKAHKLSLTDIALVNHHKSTKSEKWKMSTKEWINKLYNKRFRGNKK